MSRGPSFADRMAAVMAKVRPPKASRERSTAEPAAAAPFSFDHLRGGDPAAAFAAASREAMAKVRPQQSTHAAERRQPKA